MEIKFNHILYILLILIFIGIILLNGRIDDEMKNLDPDLKTAISICEKIRDKYDRDTCYSNLKDATNNSFSVLCKKMSKPSRRDSCYDLYYTHMAVVNNDSLICRKIKDQRYMDWCYHDVAILNNDFSLCDEIENKYHCYMDIIEVSKDPTLCYSITDEEYKDHCHYHSASILNDSSLCDVIVDEYVKNMCYYRVATNTNDITLCEKITNKTNREEETDKKIGYAPANWRDACYFFFAYTDNDSLLCNKTIRELTRFSCIALTNNDSSYCEDIKNQTDRDWCYYAYGFNKNDSNACDSISNTSRTYARKWCYSHLANSNPVLCEKMRDRDAVYICYSNVAENNDDSICSKIINESYRDYCYRVRINRGYSNDSSICSRIVDQEARAFCYDKIARRTKDPELCEKARLVYDQCYKENLTWCKHYGNWPDWCYLDIAIDENEPSLCDKIEGSDNGIYCRAITKADYLLCANINGEDLEILCYRKVAEIKKDESICEKITDSWERDHCYNGVALSFVN